jgi:acyl dehydratase
MQKPVFVGDTLRAESDVVELRESRSRPTAGIVIFRHRLLNQRNEVVCECLRTALMNRNPKRSHSVEKHTERRTERD